MIDQPRSNRPTPRTPASIEAELRRRVRAELTQARSDAENAEIDDEALAGIIARAIANALTWHVEAPEHTRGATLSSRTWRGASGPRGAGRREEDDEGEGDRGERRFEPRRFDDRRGGFNDRRGGFEDRRPPGPPPFRDRDRFPPREDFAEERQGDEEREFRGPRRPPPSGPRRPPFRGGGGFSQGPRTGGGFNQSRPRGPGKFGGSGGGFGRPSGPRPGGKFGGGGGFSKSPRRPPPSGGGR